MDRNEGFMLSLTQYLNKHIAAGYFNDRSDMYLLSYQIYLHDENCNISSTYGNQHTHVLEAVNVKLRMQVVFITHAGYNIVYNVY